MSLAKSSSQRAKKEANRGAWASEEDLKLAQIIEIHGPKKWKSLATKAGLNRCGKSCRLRWMNYLRPNIKRGNISDQEEDLILRLHKLLGNRWSLIAGRLPGRTDNEIKNYWNSHLSKKIKQMERHNRTSNLMALEIKVAEDVKLKKLVDVEPKLAKEEETSKGQKCSSLIKDREIFACYTSDEPLNLEWMGNFLEMDESWVYLT